MDDTMREVIAFWKAVMEDESQRLADRIKASENLARFCTQDAGEAEAEDRELRIFVDYGGTPCR